MSAATETKTCPRCGRDFAWRRKWAACWEQLRYCSERCRRTKASSRDARIESVLLDRLADRRGTICPSEVARALAPDGWRAWMPRVHDATRRLARDGVIEVRQKGRRIDAAKMRGPIRIARGPRYRARQASGSGDA